MERAPAGEGVVEKPAMEGVVDSVLEEANLGDTKTDAFIESVRRSLLTKTNEEDVRAHLDALLKFAESRDGGSSLGDRSNGTEARKVLADQGLEDRVIDLLQGKENPEGTPEEANEARKEIVDYTLTLVSEENKSDEMFMSLVRLALERELKKMELANADTQTIQNNLSNLVAKLEAL